jgi:hypothetical protein
VVVDCPNQLTIEQLAGASGMSVRNIRAHQARGLVSAPEVRMRVGLSTQIEGAFGEITRRLAERGA